MNRANAPAFALFILAALTACAALGINGSLSLDEKLAAAQVSETAVVNAATAAVQAGTLSSTNAQHVLDTARTMDGFLAAAKADVGAGNTTSAQSELALATSTLLALQSYVNAQAQKVH